MTEPEFIVWYRKYKKANKLADFVFLGVTAIVIGAVIFLTKDLDALVNGSLIGLCLFLLFFGFRAWGYDLICKWVGVDPYKYSSWSDGL